MANNIQQVFNALETMEVRMRCTNEQTWQHPVMSLNDSRAD